MKKIKLLLPLIAVLIAVAGVFAMKANKTDVKLDTYYYQYNDDVRDLTEYQDATNWTAITDPDAPGCPDEGEVPCVVESDQSTVANFVNSIQSTSDVESHTYATKP